MSGIQRFFVSKRVSDYGSDIKQQIDAYGGTITYAGGYKIHTFNTIGSNNFQVTFSPPGILSTVEYLIVAGGGGGGAWVGAGAGAGGMIYGSTLVLPANYPISVGSGGKGALNPGGYSGLPGANSAANGSSSSFYNITATGGGRGQSWSAEGPGTGGSGGGSSDGGAGGTGISGQGNSGGNGRGTNPYECGGGGGAGAVGQSWTSNKSGNGGIGIQSSISGSLKYYSGGGGGGAHDSGPTPGTGGLGGGGNGLTASTSKAGNGEANTGGGGGGNGRNGGERSEGGDGGSGVVIVRYLYA